MGKTEERSLVYGPVASRRLGISLGLDLIPYKRCTYDCVYCQLGRTTDCTIARAAYAPVEKVLAELRRRLREVARVDYITLAGSGEPTLQLGLDRLIEGVREITDVPVALITNGALLWDERVRRECLGLDLLVPSLDAGDEETWRRINRPHEGLSFARMLDGLIKMRREYKWPYWLEVMLVGGVNDSQPSLENIRRAAARISPDRVQLNTVSRVPAERWALKLPKERLEEIAATFGGRAEIIADFSGPASGEISSLGEDDIIGHLERRSGTLEDLAGGLQASPQELLKSLEALQRAGRVVAEDWGGRVLYRVSRGS